MMISTRQKTNTRQILHGPECHHEAANGRPAVAGLAQQVPLLNGRFTTYVNLDNAASTPSFEAVIETINHFLPYYSSVHRGTGFKSRLSTAVYDKAHEVIGRFVGANLETNTVIFGKNTTEAINKLSYRLPLTPDSIILTTKMEHHSNDLPWRNRGHVVYVDVTPQGRLDEADFERKLARHAGKVALVAITGASNVTGFLQPIHRLARKAHEAGAKILVDAAQLAPHRRVDMKPDDDPEHLDFVTLSAHKMYAPFGTGALIGPKEIFLQGPPEYQGGGVVEIVTLDEVFWAGVPDREEAGSPNVVGALAMATAAQQLMDIGFERLAAEEEALTAYALERLAQVPDLILYGETDPTHIHERVGVIPFNLAHVPHGLVAAILGYEGGIGVRHGCFCAHPYIVQLLQLSSQENAIWQEQVLAGDRSQVPGVVRISFGCYNTTEDIDRLVEVLARISQGRYQGDYQQDSQTGEYVPIGYVESLADYFWPPQSTNNEELS